MFPVTKLWKLPFSKLEVTRKIVLVPCDLSLVSFILVNKENIKRNYSQLMILRQYSFSLVVSET